jgi:prephenate dehydrogenase
MDELRVDVLVIGWGKGGKTLAAALGQQGRSVAVDKGHLRAESREHARELDADISPADHHQPLRQRVDMLDGL